MARRALYESYAVDDLGVLERGLGHRHRCSSHELQEVSVGYKALKQDERSLQRHQPALSN